MSFLNRFFGKREENDAQESVSVAAGTLVANPAITKPLSLQVLFSSPLALDPARLTVTLRRSHPTLTLTNLELDAESAARGTPVGMAGWGPHVVQIVGFNAPMPAPILDSAVTPAHYPGDLKERARNHESHVILYYAGYEADPLEQYVTLAIVAGALGGGLVTLNEAAHTSLPTDALSASGVEGDLLEFLRELPLLFLYSGFVKIEVEGQEGIWMRTYGNSLLALPDLAMRVTGHDQSELVFSLFCDVINYLRETEAQLGVGHKLTLGENLVLRLRAPAPEEGFLDSEGELFVAEMISTEQR